MNELLITAKDVAGRLAISPRTLEYLISIKAAPPYLRIGRLRRWQPNAVTTWVEEQAQLNKVVNNGGVPSANSSVEHILGTQGHAAVMRAAKAEKHKTNDAVQLGDQMSPHSGIALPSAACSA